MDILVLGGTYFIGKILVELLKLVGHSVWILNRGTKKAVDCVEQLIVDRHSLSGMKEILSGKSFDIVIDISGYTESDVAIATEALIGRFSQYIFCSSIAVCKQPPVCWPITEDHQKCSSACDNEYGYNKLAAENYLFDFGRKSKKPITVIRPVYVYGPHDYSGRLDYFFQRITKSIPVVIASNGENIIQFGYANDLCKAIIAVMYNKNSFGEVFNISGNESLSVNQLIHLISATIGKEADISYIQTSEGASPLTTNHRFADVSKARKILNIIPETCLFDGLTKTYQYWIANRGQL